MSDEIRWEMALNGKEMDDNFRSPCVIGDEACLHGRVLEAEAEAVVFISRFQIGGWDSY